MKNEIEKLITAGLSSQRGNTNREIILSYLEAGGEGIELTDLQTELLERWSRADELIKRNIGKKNREEIANILRSIYKYHRATAYKDIMDAEYVFASSKPWNKKYLIGLRIENCMKRIRDAQLSGDTKFEGVMEATLQKYIDMYPDDIINPSPKTLIFNIDNRSINGQVLPIEEADIIIEESLKNLPDGQ